MTTGYIGGPYRFFTSTIYIKQELSETYDKIVITMDIDPDQEETWTHYHSPQALLYIRKENR